MKTGNTSTGSDQVVTVDANAILVNQVDTLTKSIGWTIKIKLSEQGSYNKSVGSSGPHKIYVTYGTPSGSVVTEKRVREVCTYADGKSGIGECADAVFSDLSGSFDLSGPMWGPSPIWLLHDPSEKSQCPGLAKYVNKHFEMLGIGSGVYRYCHAKPDGTYAASTSAISQSRTLPFAGHPNPTTHDDYNADESLVHWDGSTPPGANNYEATCLFNGYHYALGVGKLTTAKDVVKAAFTSISWEYVALDSPGPPPTYKWSTCTDVPWVEAP